MAERTNPEKIGEKVIPIRKGGVVAPKSPIDAFAEAERTNPEKIEEKVIPIRKGDVITPESR
jgi:hypothetical protein